jgi:beta-fructofuranosidase
MIMITMTFIMTCALPVVGLQADERDELLGKANASVAAAAEKVRDDPSRPIFHVLPRANWLNDPNGLLFYKGWYHVFYQHNPYGDDWGNMHWGHARSKDLAHWEHLPIALWPSKSKGEEHVFSGSAWVRNDGTPIILYTSIGKDRLPEQWAAIPEDDDLIKWKKHPANPILTEAIHGDTKIHEWRDPYLFEVNGKVHLVCGGNTNGGKGGEGVVCVYRAENDDLTKWTYLGVLFKHPDPEVKNIECPIFFKLDGRWVLIVSQGQPVDWFVGDLDEKTMRFTPKTRGKVDYGQVYAPSVLVQGVERPILWGWINGVPGGKGWRHCLTMPRLLSIDTQGRLRQKPTPQLSSLRETQPDEVHDGTRRENDPNASAKAAFEFFAEYQRTLPPSEEGIVVVASENRGRMEIKYRHGQTLEVGELQIPISVSMDTKFDMRVFVDHSVVELVFDGGAEWVTKVLDFPPARAHATTMQRHLEHRILRRGHWTMRSAWTH